MAQTLLWQNKDWLKKKYIDDGMEAKEIANLCKCSVHAIQKWAWIHGLKKHGLDEPLLKNRDWLYQKYVVEKLATHKIAELLNCDRKTVYYWLIKNDITLRTKSEARKGFKYSKKSKRKMSQTRLRLSRLGLVNGKNHPFWVGGFKPFYGSNWRIIREEARKRDNYTCQACGKTQRENGRALPVHHIIPKWKFKTPEEANYLENLISYCDSCHTKIERNTYVKETIPATN